MATNFSPCKGSYVLNQYPSNVMFGMNGFHVSASGAIQGHHGPLVQGCQKSGFYCKGLKCVAFKTSSMYDLDMIDTDKLWAGITGLILYTIRNFNDLKGESFLKTLREKEKLLLTSIFSFFNNVFYSSQHKFQFLHLNYFVVCKWFEFGLVYNFVAW